MMLQIRNMESDRCISMVKNELNKLGLHYKFVELGVVGLKEDIPSDKLQLIDIVLRRAGLELMDDKKNRVIKKIKDAIYQLVYLSDDLPKPKISEYIGMKVNYDYAYLSNLFSNEQGISIEKYFIELKIERVKELLVYNELSLSDIVFKLQYSSVAHLSNQFKKITGLSPSFFKQLRNTNRHKLQNV